MIRGGALVTAEKLAPILAHLTELHVNIILLLRWAILFLGVTIQSSTPSV